jgi:hypothetical protein
MRFSQGVSVKQQAGLDRQQMLSAAEEHLGRAIELLDGARAPAQIAAHVDLALHQLRQAVAEEPNGPPAAQAGARTELQ